MRAILTFNSRFSSANLRIIAAFWLSADAGVSEPLGPWSLLAVSSGPRNSFLVPVLLAAVDDNDADAEDSLPSLSSTIMGLIIVLRFTDFGAGVAIPSLRRTM